MSDLAISPDPGGADEKSARIVDLARRRADREAARLGLAVDDPGVADSEQVEASAPVVGSPVDRSEPVDLVAEVMGRAETARRPVLPAWFADRPARLAYARTMGGYVAYHVAYRAVRIPLYAAKTAWYTPMGFGKLAWRLGSWANAERGNFALRQDAASRGDAKTWLDLDRHRQRQSSWRWWVAGAGYAGIAAGGGLLFLDLAPWWIRVPATVAVTLGLARVGRPGDKPILDRVELGPRFVRLTAAMVRQALVDVGCAKDPKDLAFPQDIHRDGPGWLARVNLPAGIEATKVLEARGRLSSALRLPVDQVWPAVGPDHAGQLDLWVGYLPSSKMGQPRWSLAAATARTSVFRPEEFGSDARQRPVKTVMFARNFLIGGVPGSGKSYAARTLAIIAALDPTVELKIAEHKGTADFGDLAPFCSTYACGVDDAALETSAGILAWGLAECERRGKRILAARKRGEAPEGKVTPELAAKRGSGLHPVVIVLDEVHELFGDADRGKKAAEDAERLIKRGRALGIIVVLATQIPDKSSLPPNITRCVTVRWCLAVQDQVANDMILGTGAYKRGQSATCYRPGDDAGWGIATGLSAAMDGPVRSQYPDQAAMTTILARVGVLRGTNVVGDPEAVLATRDLLADVLAVMPTDRAGAQWKTLAESLAERFPEAYDGIGADTVSATVRDRGVRGRQVKGSDGSNLQGCYRDDVIKAIDVSRG